VLTAVKMLEEWIEKQGLKLPKKADTPMVSSYRPELDVIQQLDSDMANFYQSQVGVLCWIIEMGR
jgi:hypothetical protein